MAEKTRAYYKTGKKWREHELQMMLLKAFAADPELKYYLGVASGAGIAVLGGMLGQAEQAGSGGGSNAGDVAAYGALGWLALGPAGAAIAAAWESNTGQSSTPQSQLGAIIGLAGGSFAAFCAAVLMLKAMSGGSDGAGILGKLTAGIV